ncbi:MAG: hypothetical protein WAV51_00515 [Microgenomates group bacterium]
MHKNTFILVVFLAIIASLLVGFNVGNKLQKQPPATIQPTGIVAVSPTPSPVIMTPYTNNYCRISLSYPKSMTVTEPATGSAKFATTNDIVILVCQNDIPGIAVEDKNTETISIGSISGTLYHTATPKDGTPIDVLILQHPRTGMDVLVSGIGSSFNAIVNSLTLTP